MRNGSYLPGLAGAIGGILLALLAIVVGFGVARMTGGGSEATAVHEKAEHH